MTRSPLFHGCLLVIAVGCRDVLGINEAEFNPGFASSGGSSSSGGDANGGSQSASGGSENEAGNAAVTSESDGGAASSDGGDSDAGSGNGGQAGSSDDPPPPPPLCETYCATISANCSGDFAQYPDLHTCLAVCHALPEGWDDGASNTVRCRLARAQKATGDGASYYCPQAGPSGGGECGWSCDGYCAVMGAFCTSQSTDGLHYYSSAGACKQACRNVPQDDDPYSVTLHSSGPHLQCRLVHACAAANDPMTECASALGGPPCESTP
jgi:hypothetical protein